MSIQMNRSGMKTLGPFLFLFYTSDYNRSDLNMLRQINSLLHKTCFSTNQQRNVYNLFCVWSIVSYVLFHHTKITWYYSLVLEALRDTIAMKILFLILSSSGEIDKSLIFQRKPHCTGLNFDFSSGVLEITQLQRSLFLRCLSQLLQEWVPENSHARMLAIQARRQK